ncbi:MAG: hypothetical protein ABIS51_21550 [Sphingomonas sp.]
MGMDFRLRPARRDIVQVLKVRKSAWIVLLIAASPVGAAGIMAGIQGDLWSGAALIAFAVGVVFYNASARVVITGHELLFRRYGLTIWRAPRVGTKMRVGSGADIGVHSSPIISAFIFSSGRTRHGWILRDWFTAVQIAELRAALRPAPPKKMPGTPKGPSTRLARLR